MRDRPDQLIRAAMLAVDWKTDYGLSVQLGIEGVVDDLNKIAGWLAEHRDMGMICIDDLENSKSSLLDNLKAQSGAHYHAPPTLNGRVRMYKTAPELHFPILFLHVATTNRAEIEPIMDQVREGTIVYGTAEACALVCEIAQCEAQPLYFHADRVVVRVA